MPDAEDEELEDEDDWGTIGSRVATQQDWAKHPLLPFEIFEIFCANFPLDPPERGIRTEGRKDRKGSISPLAGNQDRGYGLTIAFVLQS